MTHLSRKRRQFMIFLVDLFILYASIPLALFLRKLQFPEVSSLVEHAYTFTLIIVIWVLLMYSAGMYSLEQTFSGIQNTLKMSIVAGVSLLSGFALFYLFLGSTMTPKTVLFIYCFDSFVLIILWRLLYNFFYAVRKSQPRVVFIGTNETVLSLVREMKNFSYFGFTPAAMYDPDPSNVSEESVPFFSDTDKFLSYLKNGNVEICILAGEKSYPLEIRQYLFSMLKDEVIFFSLPDFFEIVTRKVPIGSINDNWLLSHLDASSRTLFNLFKRTFDLTISTVILLFTSPLWPLIALGIKLESPGPIFFKQIREGRNGKPFSILKFRTMRVEGNSFLPTDLR
jgi:FlaA1/EpsC-like NDP-sugar epimerase